MEKYVKLILSNSVEQTKNTKEEALLNVINPFVMINPVIFPTLYSFTLTILTTGIEMTGKEKMLLKITTPSGKELFETGVIPTPEMPINTNITMNMSFNNVILQEEGKYTVAFVYNEDTFSETHFFVQNNNEA